jgi:hypothetical protein
MTPEEFTERKARVLAPFSEKLRATLDKPTYEQAGRVLRSLLDEDLKRYPPPRASAPEFLDLEA